MTPDPGFVAVSVIILIAAFAFWIDYRGFREVRSLVDITENAQSPQNRAEARAASTKP